MPSGLGLAIALIAMLTLPGWAMLAINHNWRRWDTLQRWCIALGISIAFYPVLFYGLRFALPSFALSPYKLGALLVVCGAFIVWRMRGHWREQFAFDRLEWIAIGLFGMTLFTRFWIIRDHPYPAWSDSVHHAILTQLTASQGKLPWDMEPYFPIPLGQYHLGLYSLSASVQWLAGVPAHTALLWTAQAMNGLCGLGVYLVLDRKVGRTGAVVGVAVVGLLSHQPAWYVNWGRFTQVASQAVLLIAWMVTWEAIASWGRSWTGHEAEIMWNTCVAAALTGAVFLLHFQVAGFFVPLIAITSIWELWRARREHQAKRVVLGIAVIGIGALAIVSPALWEALRIFVSLRSLAPTSSAEAAQARQAYYEFPSSAVPVLAGRIELLILAGLGAVTAVLRRNKLAIAALLWVALLSLLGKTYILGLPLINITNLSATLIMWYLPIGLIAGAAGQELLSLAGPLRREGLERVMIGLILVASFIASHVRVTEIEPYRHFITPADVAAMDWIKANTPPDARFAVNTFFWLPKSPHGTDAGYWLPYLTGRQTTASVMLFGLADQAYRTSIIEMSRAEERLEQDNAALDDLRQMGVDYIYIGQKGDFSGPGLRPGRLSRAEGVAVLYQRDGVTILQIK